MHDDMDQLDDEIVKKQQEVRKDWLFMHIYKLFYEHVRLFIVCTFKKDVCVWRL